MEREEAIKSLKVLRNDFSGYKPNEEVFDMAIKAIEQEPKPKKPEVASNEEPQTIPQILEAVKEEICDKYCKWPGEFKNEEELWETMCAKCPLNRLS